MSVAHNVLGSVHLVTCFSSLVAMVLWLLPFFRLRNHPLLQKRHSELTIICAFLCMCGQVVIYLSWSIYYAQFSYISSKFVSICIWLSILLYPSIVYGIGFVSIIRYWLNYYDTLFSMASANLKWKRFINPKYTDSKQNPTRLNRNIFINIYKTFVNTKQVTDKATDNQNQRISMSNKHNDTKTTEIEQQTGPHKKMSGHSPPQTKMLEALFATLRIVSNQSMDDNTTNETAETTDDGLQLVLKEEDGTRDETTPEHESKNGEECKDLKRNSKESDSKDSSESSNDDGSGSGSSGSSGSSGGSGSNGNENGSGNGSDNNGSRTGVKYRFKLNGTSLKMPLARKISQKIMNQHHWIVVNKNKYGNLRYLIKFLIPLFIFCVLISSLLRYVELGSNIFDLIIYCVIIVIGISLYKKFPVYYDALCIYQELRVACYFFVVMILLDVVLIVVLVIRDFLQNSDNNNSGSSMGVVELVNSDSVLSHVAATCVGLTCTVGFGGCVYVTTYRVIQQLKLLKPRTLEKIDSNSVGGNNNNNNKSNNLTMTIDNSSMKDESATVGTSTGGHGGKLAFSELKQLLENSIGFDVFASYLLKQFSIECLLAYIEFLQYKENMIYVFTIYAQCLNQSIAESERIPVEGLFNNEYAGEFLKVQLPNNTPYSQIIYQDCPLKSKLYYGFELTLDDYPTMMYCFYEEARQLYMKYIKMNSKFEINISGFNREIVSNFIFDEFNLSRYDVNNIDYTPIFTFYSLFDNCIQEVYQLMQHSFVQFANTQVWKCVINLDLFFVCETCPFFLQITMSIFALLLRLLRLE